MRPPLLPNLLHYHGRIYHRNPWADTSIGVCSAFEAFRENPVHFFLHDFFGMTREVAEYFAESVFCILESSDDSRRVSAHEFGAWAKNLPSLIGARKPALTSIVTQLAAEEGQQKRQRKRGARKGKGAQNAAAAASLPSPEDDRLDSLASANQELVRELSRMSTRSSVMSLQPSLDEVTPVPALPSPQRKASRWKGVFSLQKQTTPPPLAVSPSAAETLVELAPSKTLYDDNARDREEMRSAPRQMSATASNVSNLIMGLSPPTPPEDERGRRRERERDGEDKYLSARVPADWQNGPSSASSSRVRNVSPLSTRSRNGTAPNALGPSFTSNNWRNSTSSSLSVATGTTSNYTRFSNASTRSVSTANTSVSASSWRTGGTTASGTKAPLHKPAMIKGGWLHCFHHRSSHERLLSDMNGIPWELGELPRDCYLDPQTAVFSRPPQPKKIKVGGGRSAAGGLTPIVENRRHSPPVPSKLSVAINAADAETGSSPPHSPSPPPSATDNSPKKVNKGQINALAKMLSALKAR